VVLTESEYLGGGWGEVELNLRRVSGKQRVIGVAMVTVEFVQYKLGNREYLIIIITITSVYPARLVEMILLTKRPFSACIKKPKEHKHWNSSCWSLTAPTPNLPFNTPT